jgi:1-deoxy-D-xylulose-5-phosphate reductoisomerase
VAVLGSTGSVGTRALDVVRSMPERLRVVALSGHSRWDLLAEQAAEFRPEVVVVGTDTGAERLVEALPGDVRVLQGPEGIQAAAEWENADVVLSAISGAAGLPAALAAVDAGKALALANKESVVMCGAVLAERAQASGSRILPVDSEHSAIFQLLAGVKRSDVRHVCLTASGGPFLGLSREDLARVTLEQALNHPTWDMGAKITVDSATMMNKALEVIEARWLFGLPVDRIRVLVHPQSIVHGMVELVDGSVLAHLGSPDMRLPIKHALCYPERVEAAGDRLDLASMRRLEFLEPDFEAFPALALGYRVAEAGGTSGAVLSAANEVAVEAFVSERIGFTEIDQLVETVLDRHEVVAEPSLEQVFEADDWAREEARSCLASM